MSRGLGKIERKVIDVLLKEGNETFLSNIPYAIFENHYQGKPEEPWYEVERKAHSQYISVYHAVKSLERKGVVSAKKQSMNFYFLNKIGKRGGQTCAVKVKLKS